MGKDVLRSPVPLRSRQVEPSFAVASHHTSRSFTVAAHMCVVVAISEHLVTQGTPARSRSFAAISFVLDFQISPTSSTAAPIPLLILRLEDRKFHLRRCRQVHFVAGVFRPLARLCCGCFEAAHYLALSSLHDSSTTVISQHGQLVPNRSERGCVWAPKRLQAFNLAHHQCTFLTEI